MVSLNEQSPDIARGIDDSEGHEQGAGDQGMVFGYASNETAELMPLPIMIAHKLVRRLSECRKQGILPYLRSDGKSQVTVEYVDGKPKRVDSVVIAAQHVESVDREKMREDVIGQVIRAVVPEGMLDGKTKYFVNETGRFVVGGTLADSGLTGRKIIVDTYGGVGSRGGGCFSGKDPSKVDRSGCYMARYVAKNVVAAGLADQCEVQIAYAIGVARPVSVMVNTFGTGKINDERILELVSKHFDMRPKAIITSLNLLRPIYRKTAVFGVFGRDDPDFTWERTDKADILRKEAGI
jgi:S-adenosylmethionine synthetase